MEDPATGPKDSIDSTTSHEELPAPLADLVEAVDARRSEVGEWFFEETFAEPTWDATEGGAVRNDVVDEWMPGHGATDEAPPATSAAGEATSATGAAGEATRDPGFADEAIGAEERTCVVSKREFCGLCPHFSEPPEVHCTHEGTEIVEFVDTERVRLHSCPIVEERGSGSGRSDV